MNISHGPAVSSVALPTDIDGMLAKAANIEAIVSNTAMFFADFTTFSFLPR